MFSQRDRAIASTYHCSRLYTVVSTPQLVPHVQFQGMARGIWVSFGEGSCHWRAVQIGGEDVIELAAEVESLSRDVAQIRVEMREVVEACDAAVNRRPATGGTLDAPRPIRS